MQITKNFKLCEFENSRTATFRGIDNSVKSPSVKANIKALCEKVLQPFRDYLGREIIVTSGYRCKELNEAVGGVVDSQHTLGMAADITPSDYGNFMMKDVVWLITNLSFDQLIIYRDFIHVSYVATDRNRRKLIFKEEVPLTWQVAVYRAITDYVLGLQR